jgi:VacB/RNase II family 3'-5' exoribonuclease
MMNSENKQHRSLLQNIARRAMVERGLLPDFSDGVIAELNTINASASGSRVPAKDLRNMVWCSIDNDDSRDLDQLTVAEAIPDGVVRILVAIADVDALVVQESAIDEHASHNTTSVYTAAQIFPMLPEKLSTDYTSLGIEEDRQAMIIEMVIAVDGSVQQSDVYPGFVRNHAKLAYNNVAGWLEGDWPMPLTIGFVEGLEKNLRLQERVARAMKSLRHEHGALDLETIEARPVFVEDEIRDLETEKGNAAKTIIEDFMIAANGVAARYLAAHKLPSLRRVVRTPKRWDRIVEIAAAQKFTLPREPDSIALDKFLVSSKAADPLHFPDLSLSIIKLLGAGEYVVEIPGGKSAGHFGLAVRDYAHSTAPNRRYPDLITQRLLKAAIAESPMPYTIDELQTIARHCTAMEDAAKKVERQVGKSAAAILLAPKINQQFDAIVTGASSKGTWVRLLNPPVEGKCVSGIEGLEVGHRVRVQLLHTDIDRGYIDFVNIKNKESIE